MKREDDSFINPAFQPFFTGVVEDRNDPEMMGRVRVRIFGIHPISRVQVPTEALPWATILLPVTAPLSAPAHSLVEGSWVVGFFRDSVSSQDPIVIGSICAREPPDWLWSAGGG